jgi:tol-pal system protein YbgF
MRRAALTLAFLAAAPVWAANKDVERLQFQITGLQGQLAEMQRANEDSLKEIRRLTELVAEQNALLKKSLADQRQQEETVAAGLKELGERVAEVAERLEALKASSVVLPAPAAAGGTSVGTPPAGTSPGSPAATGTTGAAPPPAAPPPAPRELYSQAYADYARGNYDLAVQGFTEYMKNYPDTDFTDNAQYWVGECLYGKKQYAEAIEAWNTLFRDYPSSDKLPDARVKKGMALERLGRRSQALVEYRYVVDRYPNTQAARIAKEHLNP